MKESQELFRRARLKMPGGGCAGGRIHRVLERPLYLERAEGSHIVTVDGEEYIDYHCGAGGILFGFNHPRLKEAIRKCVEKGFFMNFDSDYTLEFAELFTKLVPTVEKIRLTNSGTEATMAAIRLARAYTGKDLILKMDGHFHGMHEMIWYNGGVGTDLDEYGEARNVIPETPGFPQGAENHVKLIEFNNPYAVEHAFEKYKGRIAAIIMEPVNYDCGCVPSTKKYMKRVRELCSREETLLIFDEVISGLRFRPGSAQGYYGVQPDLSTFAKAVANGFSLALIGGREEIMDLLNPVGPVVCSGTSSGNLMSVMAGIECLKMALEPEFYDRIEETERMLCGGMDDLFRKHKVPGHVRSHGAQFAFYFGYEEPELDYTLSETVKRFRPDLYRQFVKECLAEHLYFYYGGDKPFPHHCGFTSAHTKEDVEITLEKMDRIFRKMKF